MPLWLVARRLLGVLLIGLSLSSAIVANGAASTDVAESNQTGSVDRQAITLDSRWRRAVADDRVERFGPLLERSVSRDSGASVPGSRSQRDAGEHALPDATHWLVTLTDRTGRTALMVACKYGDLVLARKLVNLGADARARTQTGGTPFMFAALGNQQAVAEWLQGEGADIQAAGSNGWTASMIAAAKGFADLLNWLIEAGADVNRADVYGFTPLMRAVDNRHTLAVEALLSSQRGVDVNAQDEAGNTALHHAVAGGQVALTETLLEHDASIELANRQGQTAAQLAAGNPELAALLHR